MHAPILTRSPSWPARAVAPLMTGLLLCAGCESTPSNTSSADAAPPVWFGSPGVDSGAASGPAPGGGTTGGAPGGESGNVNGGGTWSPPDASAADAAGSTDAGGFSAAATDAATEAGADDAGLDAGAQDPATDAAAEAAVDASGDEGGTQPEAGGPPTREGGQVNATIVVGPGETFEGAGERYFAGPSVGDGSQDEGQDPVFRLEDGAVLRNVVLAAPAADGIHTYGDVELENIVWEDVGEDALTIKEEGTVVLRGGSATLADDKIFQINAASTFRVSDFTASRGGKFIRQNGDTDFRADVFIHNCDISQMDEAIFRTDSDESTVTMRNTRYSNIGDELFMGVSPGNITTSDNVPY